MASDVVGHQFQADTGLGVVLPYCSCGGWRGRSTPDYADALDQYEGHLRSMRRRETAA